MAQLLLVEDDEGIAHTLMLSLKHHGHQPHRVKSAEAAMDYLNVNPEVALILLDWMLPGQNGVSFITRLRQHSAFATMPILMLTARSGEQDKVAGLGAGADDYLCKPFSMKELQARILALLRRHGRENPNQSPSYMGEAPMTLGALTINPAQREAHWGKTLLPLTDLEFRLLFDLVKHPRVVSRQELLDRVWTKIVDERTVDVTIKRLRKALEAADPPSLMLETVRGAGYRLVMGMSRVG